MTETNKEKNIIFYGKNFTPLSKDCYGCYHFGTICEGSVYRTECPTRQVEDIRPSIVASLLLRATDNRFTLARSFGYDMTNLVEKEELEGNEKLLQEFEEALKTPEEMIENYKKLYSLDQYAEQEIYQAEVSQSIISRPTRVDENPFDGIGIEIEEISDKDFPF